jgi:hypothetical protein
MKCLSDISKLMIALGILSAGVTFGLNQLAQFEEHKLATELARYAAGHAEPYTVRVLAALKGNDERN